MQTPSPLTKGYFLNQQLLLGQHTARHSHLWAAPTRKGWTSSSSANLQGPIIQHRAQCLACFRLPSTWTPYSLHSTFCWVEYHKSFNLLDEISLLHAWLPAILKFGAVGLQQFFRWGQKNDSDFETLVPLFRKIPENSHSPKRTSNFRTWTDFLTEYSFSPPQGNLTRFGHMRKKHSNIQKKIKFQSNWKPFSTPRAWILNKSAPHTASPRRNWEIDNSPGVLGGLHESMGHSRAEGQTAAMGTCCSNLVQRLASRNSSKQKEQERNKGWREGFSKKGCSRSEAE